jgi:CubicO group peptidase (beta-lactamase class C family)
MAHRQHRKEPTSVTRTLLFGCIGVTCLAATARPATQEPTFDLEKTKQVLTREIEKELAKGTASVSIALVRDGDVVWTAAFGWSNVWARTPATPATIYVVASTFKSVTATAVMQLVDRGEIALDDPVNDHLKDARIRDRGDHVVTLRHILSHVSGLTAGANTTAIWRRQLPMTLAQVTSGLEAVRDPEEAYEYNNYAYALAGYLLEQVTGTDFETYVVRNILQPLGVQTPAPVNPTPEMIERMALPYVPGPDGKPRPIPQVRYDVYPAGDVYLTAEDMARFLCAHLNGGVFRGQRILSEQSVAETHRNQFFEYGLGWTTRESDGHHIIAHAGGVPGFGSYMIGDLEARVGAYLMSNSGSMAHIARAALNLLRGERYVPPEDRPSMSVEERVLQTYVGEYEVQKGFVLSVTKVGPSLFIQAPGQPRREMFAASPTEFFLRDVDAEVTFFPRQDGVVDRLILNQDGDVHAKRR